MKENHPKLWAQIAADLTRARATLPDDAADCESVREYQEFLDNNELELACEMLEDCAREFPVSPEFWTALRDAAVKMRLQDRVARYEQLVGGQR